MIHNIINLLDRMASLIRMLLGIVILYSASVAYENGYVAVELISVIVSFIETAPELSTFAMFIYVGMRLIRY